MNIKNGYLIKYLLQICDKKKYKEEALRKIFSLLYLKPLKSLAKKKTKLETWPYKNFVIISVCLRNFYKLA